MSIKFIKAASLVCGVLLQFMLAYSVVAGGVSWSFQVQDFHEVKNGGHIFVLKPLEPGEGFPVNCPTLTVHVEYSSWRWFFCGDKMINKENHRKALSTVEKSFLSRTPIRFGSMGEGFGFQDGTASCVVYSRALSLVTVDGKDEVYSFFKWP